MSREVGRRRLLASVVAAVGTLAGCGSDGNGAGTTTAADAEDTQSTTVGAGTTGGTATTTATETATTTATETTTTTRTTTATTADTATPTRTETQAATVVTVGPGGSFEFDPEEVEVAAGETVRWEWDSGGHNVVVGSQPEAADWVGTGDESETHGSGYTYSHTFEVSGTYEYYCAPHESLGMTGTVSVTQ